MIIDWLLNNGFTSLLLIGTVVLTVFWLRSIQHKRCGYPDGPLNLPVVGNLIQVAFYGSVSNFLQNYQHIYGNVFTVEFGGHKRVVISGYDNMYKLLVKTADYTSNRSPMSFVVNVKSDDSVPPGILWAPFPHWKTLRSFALNVLREEGMGKQSIEPMILEETEQFCAKYIDSCLGEPVNICGHIAKAASNIISEMIFEGRLDYDDPKSQYLMDAISYSVRTGQRATMTRNIPLIKYISASGNQKVKDLRTALNKEMDLRLQQHKNNQNGIKQKDIFDEFLNYRAKVINDDIAFTDNDAIGVAAQLFVAGTVTISAALNWLLLYTCYHPDVMSKVQQEIDERIGCERLVVYIDHRNMPYTEAVLLETFRLANITPVALPHTLEKEIIIDGVKIPIGADLMFNMASILFDEKVFESPNQFKPERFLTGDIKMKKKRVIPFSLGRRACLGESLARMEIFLMYITILQKYTVTFPENKKPSLIPPSAIIHTPKPYEIIFTRRK